VPASIPSALMSSSMSGQWIALTIADDLVSRSLGWAGSGEPPRPGKSNADHPTVDEMSDDCIIGDLDARYQGIAASRSAHSTPP
jgi:hypothetical protein